MDALERYTKLEKAWTQARKEADKAEGVLEQNLKALKDGFGCDNEDDGNRLLERTKKERQERESELSKGCEEFEERWEGKL